MDVTIHSGRDRIGNACLEVTCGRTRVILDCGWPLEEEAERTPPKVPGLFGDAAAPPDAVLLSHAHPDHTGFISEIAAKIPFYATAAASKIMKVGRIYAGGVAIPREHFREVPVPRSANEPVQSFAIGELQITAYPVDHSSPGAVAYLLENGDDRTLYTGDLRLHGRKPGMHRRIERDLTGKLNLLITEGTNVGRPPGELLTEEAVETHALSVAREHPSLLLAAYSPQNLDRFVSYFRAAKAAVRIFVCDHYQAAVLHQLNLRALPKLAPRGPLRVYLPRRRKVIEKYERHFQPALITLDEILATPERHVMLARPSIIAEDFASRPPKATRLLYGLWTGYRCKPEWRTAEAALESVGGEIIHCHSSGHAHGQDLLDFIDHLNPKTILPVHTTAATIFRERFGAKCITLGSQEEI